MAAKPSGDEPGNTFMMPAIFGMPQGEEGTLYRDVLSLAVTYRAPAEKIEGLLPEKFRAGAEPANEPLVTVYYARNRDVDWLAGGGYNLLGVDVAATYRTTVRHFSSSRRYA